MNAETKININNTYNNSCVGMVEIVLEHINNTFKHESDNIYTMLYVKEALNDVLNLLKEQTYNIKLTIIEDEELQKLKNKILFLENKLNNI